MSEEALEQQNHLTFSVTAVSIALQICRHCSPDTVAFLVQYRPNTQNHPRCLGRLTAPVGSNSPCHGTARFFKLLPVFNFPFWTVECRQSIVFFKCSTKSRYYLSKGTVWKMEFIQASTRNCFSWTQSKSLSEPLGPKMNSHVFMLFPYHRL